MPRDYNRGKCNECGKKGRVWEFEWVAGGLAQLCGKCQQILRHARKVKRSPNPRRITPTNEELRILAKKHPAPQEWYDE